MENVSPALDGPLLSGFVLRAGWADQQDREQYGGKAAAARRPERPSGVLPSA